MLRRLAIRVDASTEIGTGHFMRCLTLANTLKQRGSRIRFVSRHMPAYLREMLVAKGHEFMLLSSTSQAAISDGLSHADWLGTSQTQDAVDTIQALSDQIWDWLVVDHYALDVRWESMFRQIVKKVLVIDDLADRVHDCDMLLDQNFYMDMGTRYTGKVPAHCKLFLGPHYALLRDDFQRLRGQVKPRIGPIKRILVFFGGIDLDNYTIKAIDVLVNLGIKGVQVDVVIGSQHPYREDIESVCARHNFACHTQTNRMAELMAAANLAIGAGGSASWERCCLGLPAIILAVAKNQEQASRALANQGVVYLGEKEMTIAEIERAVQYLCVSDNLHRMSVKAAELVDGLGAIRMRDALFLESCS